MIENKLGINNKQELIKQEEIIKKLSKYGIRILMSQ